MILFLCRGKIIAIFEQIEYRAGQPPDQNNAADQSAYNEVDRPDSHRSGYVIIAGNQPEEHFADTKRNPA